MFVRGVSNVTSIERIEDKVADTALGIVYPELRTKDDTLSIWYIKDKQDFVDAALNIILPRDRIAAASFVLLETAMLDENDLTYIQKDPDRIVLSDSKAKHYDITGVTVGKIESILKAYKAVYQHELEQDSETYIITWGVEESRESIIQAVRDGRVKCEMLQPKMQEKIQRLMNA